MAEKGSDNETSADDRTEDPTQQRIEQARRDGNVPFSREPAQLLILVAMLVWMGVVLPTGGPRFLDAASAVVARAGEADIDRGTWALDQLWSLGLVGATLLAPLFVLTLLAPVIAAFAQQSVVISTKKLAPDLARLSPLAGIKRLVSAQNLVEFLKNLTKVVVAMAIAGLMLRTELIEIVGVGTVAPASALGVLGELTRRMLTAVVAFAAVLAVMDVVWQRVSWFRKLKMTRQELKDEMKNSEGNPEVKAKRRQLHRERSQRRMMVDVPRATVVITNPTHFAVALAYDEKTDPVPRVVAKGRDAVALRIRAVAEEARVPVVGNPPMARLLHATLEVGDMIRPEHYKAVAEIIGYVLGRRR